MERLDSIDLLPILAKLETVVAAYKKHERLDSDAPPAHGGVWAVRSGHVKRVTNVSAQEGIFTRRIVVGVQIGTKFAEPVGESTPETRAQRVEVVERLKAEIKAVMAELKAAHGGFVSLISGSSYAILGWCQP